MQKRSTRLYITHNNIYNQIRTTIRKKPEGLDIPTCEMRLAKNSSNFSWMH